MIAWSSVRFIGLLSICILIPLCLHLPDPAFCSPLFFLVLFAQVIVGTHILMANGGTIAHTGALNIALAARAHQVPYVVVTELYKLCPLYAFDQVCCVFVRAVS